MYRESVIRISLLLVLFFLSMQHRGLSAEVSVLLATDPELSSDGSILLFVHRGDIWSVPTTGGRASRLTVSSASDREPKFSPDGAQIAFTSDRTGSRQLFVMPADGGLPTQLTFHTEGCSLQDWYPDGSHLLVSAVRDHFWRSASRFFRISATDRQAEHLLFNDYGSEGTISPDGDRLLFVREGEREWRKGYHGARAAQIWMLDLTGGEFTKVVHHHTDSRSPVWLPDGSGFLYCGSQDAENGARNLWKYSFESSASVKLTHFEDDLVTQPVISSDGSTIVFRHLFDFYRLSVDANEPAARISITENSDDLPENMLRRTLTSVSDADFTADGLEIAFIAGGDLWVMETELKEPVQVTNTAEFESDPVFHADGNSLFVSGWKEGQPDIMKVTRADESKYWWQNTEFHITRLTNDAAVESSLKLSPDGSALAYLRERGDLWIHELETGNSRLLVSSFSGVQYDFSPDGKWIAYSKTDDDFNSDIWVVPVDLSQEAVNISRHPDDERSPVWSPDGKLIAFTGRRSDDEIDIYYVWLTAEDDALGSRDRRLEKTLQSFSKTRKKKPDESVQKDEKKETPAAEVSDSADPASAVSIDFSNIHRRLRRLSIPNSNESGLSWSPDSTTLIFSASVGGESGTYSVQFPDKLTPKKITSSVGRVRRWLKSPDRVLWIASGGSLASQSLTGPAETYSFSALQALNQSQRFTAGFETAWRVMRDFWYDENLGNRNWDQIRQKYLQAAGTAGDVRELAQVIELMLGELNGSHLGFSPRSGSSAAGTGRNQGSDDESSWRPVTVHLGVRFDDAFKGPGLRIRDVIPDGPAENPASRLEPAEIILSIDGIAVDPMMDLTTVLNGQANRDLRLRVRSAGRGAMERDVVLRPTSYAAARIALYRAWMDGNRRIVARRADNIGYLHIRGMDWPSFQEFERELYDVGYGMDGLIIDVRDNGGGSTTDHLLTALTQPRHAITVPRGGGPGYPQSRMVYATWDKPIVVLCNQNSYSNAEIFSHAIKGLKRGKLVGVPTAGGVVSTGAEQIMDLGTLRLPFRGWFVKWTGEDMELNGAVPDVVVWPLPAEIPNGRDRQLNRAVQVLQKEIKAWKSAETPTLKKATER